MRQTRRAGSNRGAAGAGGLQGGPEGERAGRPAAVSTADVQPT